MVLGIFSAVLLLTVAEPAAATQLGDLAISMKPGEWRQLTTTNVGIISQWFTSITNVEAPAYDDSAAAWNSKKRKFYVVTATDPDRGGQWTLASPLFAFDDDTNTWTQIAPPPHTGASYHAYDHVTWDDANEVLYYRRAGYLSKEVYRYCVNNTPSYCTGQQGQWTLLPLINTSPNDPQTPEAITYHEAMGKLLFWIGVSYGIGCGGLHSFDNATNQWTAIGGAGCAFSGVGQGTGVAEYSRVKQVAIFGGGGGSQKLWKINASGTISPIADAPFGIGLSGSGSYGRKLIADPISGNFILIGGLGGSGNAMYEYDVAANTWNLLDPDLTGAGKICHTKAEPTTACGNEFYGAAISNYGVIGFWKWTGTSDAEFWLYKRQAPASGSPAPPTSLTVR